MKRGWRYVAIALVVALAGVGWFLYHRRGRPKSGGADTTRTSTTPVSGTPGRPSAAALDPRHAARAAITGRVVDEAGAPIVGARVCAATDSDDLPAADKRDPTCATTASGGAYRLEPLLAARWEVTASQRGYLPRAWRGPDRRETIHLDPGETRSGIDITLVAGGVEVRGRVLDVTGGGIAEARVWVHSNRTWTATTGHSDQTGAFALWVAPGEISVSADADGYSPGWSEAIAPGEFVEVLLTPESALIGLVVDAATREPLAGAQVRATPIDEWSGGRSSTAVTGDDGRFRIDRLEPGRYKPIAEAQGRYGEARESVLLGLGQTSEEIVIETHASAIVSGRVVIQPGGAPCEEGNVTLAPAIPDARSSEATIAKDGAFVARAVLPGEYVVRVSCRRKLSEEKYPKLTVVDKDVTGLVYAVHEGRAIRGTVVHPDGKPSTGAWIRATPQGVDPKAHQTRGWGSTENDGTFEILALLPGDYDLGVTPSDAPAPETPPRVTVAADGDTEGVKVTLGETGAIAGTVVDEDGAPQGGADVRARGGKRWSWRQQARTADDGSFELKGVAPGETRVTASRGWTRSLRAPGKKDDDVQGERVAVKAGETVRVRLVVERQSGTIRGRVVDAKGAPVADAFVSATRESDRAGASEAGARHSSRWTWNEKPVVTDIDGGFVVEKLSPGRYTVRADRRGGGEAIAEHVEVGSTITLTLAETGSIAGTVADSKGRAPALFRILVDDDASGLSRAEGFFRTGGAWAITDLPPGSYRVTVRAAEGTDEEELTLAPKERRQGVVLVLEPRATIVGQVVALDGGAPIPGMSVAASPAKGGGGAMFSMSGGDPDRKDITGADGRYTLDNAPAGRLLIRAWPIDWQNGEYMASSVYVTVEGGGIVEAPPLRAVKMRMKLRDRAGDLGYTLKESPPGTEVGQSPLEVSFVRADGPAAAAGLAVGDVIVSIDGHDVTGENQMLSWSLMRVPEGTAVRHGLARGVEITITAGTPQ